MSSPGSSSHVGKRKRTFGNMSSPAGTAEMDQDQIIQTESRDASGEEGDTTAPESNVSRQHKRTESATGGHPPSKRQRANSTQTGQSSAAADQANALDPGEPSDTTEASIDIAERVARKGRKTGNGATKGADDRERKDSSMAPPPIGKLTH